MFRNVRRDVMFRERCRMTGLNEETTEIFVYINGATDEGKKGLQVFEGLSLTDRLSLAVLRRVESVKPHIGNIEKLYTDPTYRNERYRRYCDIFHICYNASVNLVILRHLGAVRVKGKENPEKVYELIARKDDLLEDNHWTSLDCYHTGYRHYVKQEWPKAIQAFEKGHALRPKDFAFNVMIQRCEMYNQLPHMEDFKGVFL